MRDDLDLRPTTADVRRRAIEILHREVARLSPLLAPHTLTLIGGSSVVGALNRGDVGLHVRVAPGDLADVVRTLRATCRVVHLEIWQPTLATIEIAGDVDTGVAVTPVGSQHDVRFTVSWERLSREPRLLERYNAVKLASTADDYEERKSRFFDDLEASGMPGAGTDPVV